MRKFLLRVLFVLIPFLWWIYASAQPKKERDCSTSCFSSEVVSVDRLSSSCTAYELKVSFTGSCAHALSHFTVAIPCGQVQDVRNSEGWKIEFGKDPTSGLTGFKIDDISDFGERGPTFFTVTFTLCSTDEECKPTLACWQPYVAYKAATCINYETLAVSCSKLEASLIKQDASCHAAEDGSLSVVIGNGQEPFTYLWSDGSTEAIRNSLPAGDYAVTVSDASGSEVTLQETIHQPDAIAIEGTTTSSGCNAEGSIDITVSGGTGAYTFAWSNGATTEDLSSLAPGTYSVTVTDEKQCSSTASFAITSGNSGLQVAGATINPDCNTANGSIDITVTGGSGAYTFLWSNGATTEDLSDIAAGLYSVTVTDPGGCSQERSFFLREVNTLSVSGVTMPTSCADDASGEIDLTVSGGSAPYEFQWSNGATTEDLKDLTSGFYTVTVTDAKGCEAKGAFTISKQTFQVARTVTQPSCNGSADGSIVLAEPVGGTGPYTYEWSTGDNGTSLFDLGPGTYLVTITDATGCSRTISTMITDPSPLSVSASATSTGCGGDASYAIDLEVSGGTAPYHFDWSDGSTSEDRSGLNEGQYQVTITDARGCSITHDIEVTGQGQDWACTIEALSAQPVCGSTGNTLSSAITDADTYQWSVESQDDTWAITAGDGTSAITFNAGSQTSATFTLIITKDGCTQLCTYVVEACTPDPGGEDPGDEDPGNGDDEPGDGDDGPGDGDDEPGGEQPGNGNETCEECFQTEMNLISSSGGCRTYEMTIRTDGLCRHDLSHWTIAIPCGAISDYSNSEGWKMEFGKDPTTGLYGLKVDDISSFGKRPGSFTVRFTLCESGSCDLSYWDPVVAYKAGLCVAVEPVEPARTSATLLAVYPNPFNDEIRFEWTAQGDGTVVEIVDQYGNMVFRTTEVIRRPEGYRLTLQSQALPRGMYYYRMTVDGRVWHGKLTKR